ncbi:hypothetical protein [Hahella ganghwensis]|uniref:hypothetical protein n=1 Tax=Hahella ganghwensis TaxID=286420 RepID=UPI00037BA2AF|nr:hypothetical protein [Hahella ganghwensis]
MDLIAQAAINHLQTVLAGYLPAVSAASITRDLLVIPKRIKPLGIGGYVGMHDDPEAEIYGRFLEAEAEIRVSENSSNLSTINNEISGLTTAILSTDRETLRSDGIYKLDLDYLSPPDSDNKNARVATFNIQCEYQQIPVDPGGMIDDIVIRNLLNPANGRASFIANIDATQLSDLADPLIDFHPLTDTDINASSPNANWNVNGAEERIEQLNNVRGGGLTLAQPRKAGAQLLIRPAGLETPVQHLALSIRLSTDSQEGIGCVMRWQDSENYYYFLISQANNYQVFGKKIAGVWSFLESGGQSAHDNIDLSERQHLQVVVLENQFKAYLNEQLICEGEDNSIDNAGEAGLLTHGNNAAYFHEIDLVKLFN